MPITLQEMKVGLSDKVQAQVVDTFVRKSELLELLPFDNAVSPSGGSTLTYGYVQKKLPSATAFRAINAEYTASQATVEKKSVDLKVLGGAFEIDRVIKDAEGQFNNLALQLEEKIVSAIGTFHNSLVNGDVAVDANSFDGLDKFLVGQTTEYNTGAVIDLSTTALIKANADEFYEALLKLINSTGAHALLVNETAKTKIQTVARILGYKTESEEAFGRVVTSIGEGKVRLIDLGNTVTVSGAGTELSPYEVNEAPIIGTKTRAISATQVYTEVLSTVSGALKVVADTATPTTGEVKVSVANASAKGDEVFEADDYVKLVNDDVTGLSDIYAVRFSVLDGFHGVTLTGNSGINSFLPDFNQPGAVKKGEVELVACVALKNTKAAGVLRNVKIV